MASNWNLSSDHKVRYFGADDLEKVLKSMRKFVKDNNISVQSISFSSSYAYDQESGVGGIYWNAVVVYTGPVNGESNA